jgi:hypothetical protein
MASFILFAIFFFSAIILFVLFGLTWLIFGKLMRLQIKRWFMASKGYVEVEHISDTKVRNYFIMRPSKNKFDISDGFYHYIPECVTRKGDILRKFDSSFLTKVPEVDDIELEGMNDKEKMEYVARVDAEWKELKGLYKVISGLKYDPQLLNRKFGMPVITYYGDNPDPMNYSDRTKSYGSGVIKDMYLRLLLTQRFKDFQMIVAVMLISMIVVAIAVFGLWRVHLTDATNYHNCLAMVNETNMKMTNLLNTTIQRSLQSSTIVVS